MLTAEKKYLKPGSVDEALKFASEYSDFKYIAGGTDLLVNRFQGNEISNCLIDLTGINELNGISINENHLRIGTLVKLSELNKINTVRKEFPVLLEAANSVGSPLVRNSATIGGNLLCENRCFFYNQSDWWRESIGYCLKCDGDKCLATGTAKACYSEFVSDMAPALISLNAQVIIIDTDGEKTINLEDIYSGDGICPVNLKKTAILKSIWIPLNRKFRSIFNKLRQRESLEFTSLTSSVSVDKENNLKIALSGVDPKPVVVIGNMKSDSNELIKEAIKKSRSVDNVILSRQYRKEMINVFLKKSFEKLLTS